MPTLVRLEPAVVAKLNEPAKHSERSRAHIILKAVAAMLAEPGGAHVCV